MTKISYIPEKCECCGQTTTYLLGVDRGTSEIVKAVYCAIRDKKINYVHVNKELVAKGYITPLQMTNMTRARGQGLIARVDGKPGNYCLTRKGAAFLKGEFVPKYAIMSKELKKQIGYFEPDVYRVSIHELQDPNEPRWEGVNYEILEGAIIEINPQKNEVSNLTA